MLIHSASYLDYVKRTNSIDFYKQNPSRRMMSFNVNNCDWIPSQDDLIEFNISDCEYFKYLKEMK